MGRILFDEENEFGKLRCFVQDGGYGFLVIAGGKFSAAVYDYSPKSAESLALALLDDLGKGMK